VEMYFGVKDASFLCQKWQPILVLGCQLEWQIWSVVVAHWYNTRLTIPRSRVQFQHAVIGKVKLEKSEKSRSEKCFSSKGVGATPKFNLMMLSCRDILSLQIEIPEILKSLRPLLKGPLSGATTFRIMTLSITKLSTKGL
jgi:hypothetical protein